MLARLSMRLSTTKLRRTTTMTFPAASRPLASLAACAASSSVRGVKLANSVPVGSHECGSDIHAKVASVLEFDLADGSRMQYDALWLAHNCASLRQAGTGQRVFSLSDLVAGATSSSTEESSAAPSGSMPAVTSSLGPGSGPGDGAESFGRATRITHAELVASGSKVRVHWQVALPSGVTFSEFSCAWLVDLHRSIRRSRRPRPLAAVQMGSRGDRDRFNTSYLPQICFAELHDAEGKGRLKWVQALHDHGLCLIKDLPMELEGTEFDDESGDSSVVQLGRLIAEPPKTLYGQDFDVRTEPNPINIAYTNAELDLHMDLAYFESPPGIQMLHCLQNDQSMLRGGESLLIDVHHCAELFRAEDPEAFAILCEVPATFIKDHLERAHPAQMFYRRPHFALDAESGDLAAVFWSPSFEGPLLGSVENVRRYHQAYVKFASLLKRRDVREAWLHEFVLQPGEVITFNQRRMLHGRRGFEWREGVQPASPEDRAPRHLKGTYLNIDDFLSTYRVLRYKAGLSPRGLDDADHVGCRSS